MTKNQPAEGPQDVVYQVRLPLSKRTIDLVAGLIRRRRNQLGTRWRKLAPGAQAVIVLAVLRHDQRLADGNHVSAATVRRWVLEVLTLLSTRAPRLDRALKKIARRGGVVVLLDGTLVRTRRRTGADNRKNFSGKHKAHGLLFLALTDEKGNLIWISAAKPGRSSEITAARHNKITGHLREAGLGALADLGFVGLDDDPDDPAIITGRKATRNHRLTNAKKEANRLLNRERAAVEHGFTGFKATRARKLTPGQKQARAPVEHGFANLKAWRVLTKLRTGPGRATALLRALLVLTNLEAGR
ncbi:transposase family protein [Streptomyces sp. TP-A0356]|uniref:transposase family protein n=1 Tax=Streptomyces sp. TP-A0356 TaxID=1359208 RepID=UPI0006E3004F|nr:transposase family protein [Streptomyces sp. TP-A0356]